MLFDKITDELFPAKRILEDVMKNKQSITPEIVKKVEKAEDYIIKANNLIIKTDYFKDTINSDFLFLKEDPNFMLINAFYNDVMNVLTDVQQKYTFFGKKLLDI